MVGCATGVRPTNNVPLASGFDRGLRTPAEVNSCHAFYIDTKKNFNATLFQVYKADLLQRREVTEEEIRASFKTPERFLAVIEVLSEKEKYKGFNFEDRLKDLSDKELKKLKNTLLAFTRKDKLSTIKFSDLMVSLYRLFHKPKGYFRTRHESRTMTETFDKLDDSVIRERIETSMFNENMESTFKVIITDPTARERFVHSLKESAPWIDTALFLALWGGNIGSRIAMGVEIDVSPSGIIELLPPYIPGFGQFLKISLTKDDLQMARKHGLKIAVDKAHAKLQPFLNKIHSLDVARWVYSSIFTTYFAMTLGFEYQAMKQQQKLDAVEEQIQAKIAENKFRATLKAFIEDTQRAAEKTDEEKGEESFQDYLAILDRQGTKYDINSPEIQAIRKQRIEWSKAAGEAQKKQNPN